MINSLAEHRETEPLSDSLSATTLTFALPGTKAGEGQRRKCEQQATWAAWAVKGIHLETWSLSQDSDSASERNLESSMHTVDPNAPPVAGGQLGASLPTTFNFTFGVDFPVKPTEDFFRTRRVGGSAKARISRPIVKGRTRAQRTNRNQASPVAGLHFLTLLNLVICRLTCYSAPLVSKNSCWLKNMRICPRRVRQSASEESLPCPTSKLQCLSWHFQPIHQYSKSNTDKVIDGWSAWTSGKL